MFHLRKKVCLNKWRQDSSELIIYFFKGVNYVAKAQVFLPFMGEVLIIVPCHLWGNFG